MPTTKPVASRIDVESKEQIDAAAAELGSTPSEYLKRVIEDHLDQNPYDVRALQSSNESFIDFTEKVIKGLE